MKLVASGSALALLLAPVAVPASAPFTFSSSTLQRGQTVEIHNINGEVTVRQGDRLEITATKRSEHGNPDDVRVIAKQTDSGVSACVRYPGDDRTDCDGGFGHAHNSNSDNDTTVTFEVRVPRGVNVVANGVNGDVRVHSDALASARTVNGRITVDADNVSAATTVNGAIDVHIHSTSSAMPLSVHTVNGAITCTLPSSVGLNVHIKVLNGSISAGGLTVQRPQFGPGASADGVIGDGKRTVDLHTLNGSVSLMRV